MLLGLAINFVGAFIVLVAAFKESVWWGLGSLFVPIIWLIFVIVHWARAKKGFLLQLAGIAVMAAGAMVTFMNAPYPQH